MNQAVTTGTGRPPAGELERGAGELERGAGEVERRARREERHPAYRRLARAGLVARAIVYFLIGGLTLEIAIAGHSSAGPDSRGAFAEIARQPAGRELLAVLAAGVLCYTAWRFVQAAAGADRASPQTGEDRRLGLRTSTWQRVGWFASGVAYLVLFAEAIDIIVGASSSGGPGEHPQPVVATLLRAPAGAGVIGLVGAGIAAGGIALGVWGAVHRYDRVLRAEEMSRRSRALARATGIAGDLARGLSIVLVASYLFLAAVTNDPSRARAVDAALQSLVGLPGGREVLALLAVGMIAFAVYSLFEVRYRRL